MGEVWKGVIGFEDLYEVSSEGRVRSKDRLYIDSVGRVTKKAGKYLKLTNTASGYLKVCLSKENKKYYKVVHRLVAEAFIGSIEGKLYVNHKDLDKVNNKVENLEWVTPRENNIHYKNAKSEEFASKFVGVTIKNGVIHSRVFLNNAEYNLGRCDSEEEAYNRYILAVKNYEDFGELPKKVEYKYVTFNKQKQKFETYLRESNKYFYIGSFDLEIDAIKAREEVLKIYKETGVFPVKKFASKYPGISFLKRLGKWQATARVNGVRKYIGVFQTEEEANEAVQKYNMNNKVNTNE